MFKQFLGTVMVKLPSDRHDRGNVRKIWLEYYCLD